MTLNAWKKGLAVVASMAAVGALMAGCGTTTKSSSTTGAVSGTGAPREGGSITLDSVSNFRDLDPALNYDTASNELVSEMYDTLVTYKGATSTIVPSLAKNWDVAPDGKTYTFHLRQGVTFWNGDKMTAQSFIDEFQRVLNPQVASPAEEFINPIIAGSTAYNKGLAKIVAGLSAPNPYTLVIHLTKPEPFFLDVLAMPFFSAVDQTYITKVGNKAFDSTTAMGTGPFELSSMTTNTVVLTKNPHYWKKDANGNPLPYLNKVTININKNAELDAMNFEQGQTALMGNLIGIPSSVYPQFAHNPKMSPLIVKAPLNAVQYLGLNASMAPLNKVKVRQAVQYAINKKKVLQLLNNRGQLANQPLPPGIEGHLSNLPADVSYSYNIAKAKELLAQAGYPNGFTTTLYTANNPDALKVAASIQNDLAQVGIKVNIQQSDWNTFLDIEEKGKANMFLTGWFQDFPDASDFLDTLFNTNQQPVNNAFMYSNPQVDAWLNQAQTDNNATQRMSLYNKVTEQVMKDAPMVPLYYPVQYSAVQSWVHGFYISPTLPDPLQYIWLDAGH